MEFEYEFPEMESENSNAGLAPHVMKLSSKEVKLNKKEFQSSP